MRLAVLVGAVLSACGVGAAWALPGSGEVVVRPSQVKAPRLLPPQELAGLVRPDRLGPLGGTIRPRPPFRSPRRFGAPNPRPQVCLILARCPSEPCVQFVPGPRREPKCDRFPDAVAQLRFIRR
jgi:hypothetical protein